MCRKMQFEYTVIQFANTDSDIVTIRTTIVNTVT